MKSSSGGARRAISAAVDVCFDYPCAFSARPARLNSRLGVAKGVRFEGVGFRPGAA